MRWRQSRTRRLRPDLADIFKSTDGGKTWTALAATGKKYANASTKVGGLLNQQGWYNQLVLVDPANPSIAYFGGALLLAKTTDGGSTFRQVTDWLGNGFPYVHADFHAGWFDATGLWIGTDGGVFQSTDGGTTFSNSLNNGLVTHLLYSVGSSPANRNAVIGGLQDNGTRVREAATTTFDETIGGDGFGAAIHRTTRSSCSAASTTTRSCARPMAVKAGRTQRAESARPAIRRTRRSSPRSCVWDGSTTGNDVYTFSNTKIYKSTNFGTSWTALPTSPVTGTTVMRNINVAASNQNIIGALGSGGVVSLSHDGGATWTQVASGEGTDPTALPDSDRSLSWIQFDVTDPNTVYVASVAPEASVNHLWKSTDFGAHWTAVTGAGLPEGIPVDLIKSDPKPLANQPDKVLYAGTHLGIYRSTDGGATWTRFGAGMPLVEVTDLYISPDETLVRAATFGRGFWELGGPADDFSITANPTSLTVAPGASGTVTLDTAITWARTVDHARGERPPGRDHRDVHAVDGERRHELDADADGGCGHAGGHLSLTVTGTSASATHSTAVSFVVTPMPNFAISANPTSVTAMQGTSNTTTISTSLTSGTAESVALWASGVPTGATATFSPTSVTAGGSSTLTLAAGTAAPGTYSVTVAGTAASATHSTTVSFTVTAAVPNDFGITANPSSVSVVQGQSGMTSIDTSLTSGSAQTVALTASGVPTGATATFTPTSVTAGGSSMLTLASGSAAPGIYTITVTGTGSSATHTTTVTFTVTAQVIDDFSISANASGVTLVQGRRNGRHRHAGHHRRGAVGGADGSGPAGRCDRVVQPGQRDVGRELDADPDRGELDGHGHVHRDGHWHRDVGHARDDGDDDGDGRARRRLQRERDAEQHLGGAGRERDVVDRDDARVRQPAERDAQHRRRAGRRHCRLRHQRVRRRRRGDAHRPRDDGRGARHLFVDGDGDGHIDDAHDDGRPHRHGGRWWRLGGGGSGGGGKGGCGCTIGGKPSPDANAAGGLAIGFFGIGLIRVASPANQRRSISGVHHCASPASLSRPSLAVLLHEPVCRLATTK